MEHEPPSLVALEIVGPLEEPALHLGLAVGAHALRVRRLAHGPGPSAARSHGYLQTTRTHNTDYNFSSDTSTILRRYGEHSDVRRNRTSRQLRARSATAAPSGRRRENPLDNSHLSG